MYDFIRGTKEFQFDEAFVKNPSSSLSSVQKIRQALLLFVLPMLTSYFEKSNNPIRKEMIY